ncbi:hypothetical protein I79_006574 [Cricetulus griseus]|uniref:Uncharacterized protein n=1 Tax=Cricetulus griseus TaxID=10029 RepID=G3H876_CRIGR|nr:hypothetical protein I79_006574 [Cricetulus griseus]
MSKWLHSQNLCATCTSILELILLTFPYPYPHIIATNQYYLVLRLVINGKFSVNTDLIGCLGFEYSEKVEREK